MTFNIVASQQGSTGAQANYQYRSVTGSFLAGDLALVLTMPNGAHFTAGENYSLPTGYTPVTDTGMVTSGNYIHFGYYTIPSNITNYSTSSFWNEYGTFLGVVRGYVVKEAYVGTLPQTRTLAVGEVIVMPGATGQTGFTQWGLGYDISAQYSGSYREITSAGSYTIPAVTQYGNTSFNFIILGLPSTPPTAPTGLTVTNSPVPLGSQATATWVHNDPDSSPQTQYQIRWRKV